MPEQRPPTVLNLAPVHSTVSSERPIKKNTKKVESTRKDMRRGEDLRERSIDNQQNSERSSSGNQTEEQSRGEMRSCKRMPGRGTRTDFKSDSDQSDIRLKGMKKLKSPVIT